MLKKYIQLSSIIICGLLFSQKSFAQCFQIESVLVDACGPSEGLNEMVRFKIGSTAQNTGNLSVTWPNNPWQGLVQNATTASNTATLNGDILDAGGCGQLIEPTNGVLPANANVILVTSYNLDTALNSFGALTQNVYILYQNNPATTSGHFANSGTGLRALTISFGSCSDSVTYDRALLIDINGNTTAADGAIVQYTPDNTATYINNGCSAPVDPFTVDAGPSSINACAGATISLNGNAEGYVSVHWSSASGSFSSPDGLSTNYTLSPTATGTISLTLTATNICGLTITDTINVNVVNSITPTFAAAAPICAGATLAPLPTTSINGITGTWSPALNNTATTVYTFTPGTGQCAQQTTLTITVNSPSTIPTFAAVAPICSGAALAPLPITSINGITGTWSPALNNIATTVYTFIPGTGQCAVQTTLTITVNSPSTIPTFAVVAPICSGATLAPLPTTSINGITGNWSPALNNIATTLYTFAPNIGQCAVQTTLTVTINSDVTPTFSAVAPICSGAALAPLPTTSINGITGTWSPALNNTTTTVYTFTPGIGQCALQTTLTITINSGVTPTFAPVAPICSGATLAPLPTTSINGITGMWSPALNNTATTVYTFTPDTGQCAQQITLTITVNSGITPTFAPVAPICSGATLTPLPITSINGITGMWSPALNNTATTVYTFTPDTAQCAVNTIMSIVVSDIDFGIDDECINGNYILQAISNADPFDINDIFEWRDQQGHILSTEITLNVTELLSLIENPVFPITYELTVQNSQGCSKIKTRVVDGVFCDIQKGITPNEDGDNDVFDLSGLGVAELKIFNRYGMEVNSFRNYTNQWGGSSTKGEELPDGTYFYVIQKNNGEHVTGWIYILRSR
jgi:gliding motility-associated-like protein